jgi:hypothetical protein
VLDIPDGVDALRTTIAALSGVGDEFFNINPNKCPRFYSVKSNVSVSRARSGRVTARRGSDATDSSAWMPIMHRKQSRAHGSARGSLSHSMFRNLPRTDSAARDTWGDQACGAIKIGLAQKFEWHGSTMAR